MRQIIMANSPGPTDDPPSAGAEGTYQPLASIWEGTDADLIERMLEFYPQTRPRLILDATSNARRFWRGSTRPVIGLDINPVFQPDVVADNRRLPFRNDCFDVVVYDPPHVPNQGPDRSKDFNTRFGLVLRASGHEGYGLSHLYPPFTAEAFRVLVRAGILLCKITDYIHNHRYHWAHLELIAAARDVGFCACDCIIKARKGPIVDPRWTTAHHARRRHCYWLIFRKSGKCE